MKNFIFAFLQFLLLFYLLFSGPLYIFSIPFVLILIVSILLIFWAILVKQLNKPHKSTPRGVYLVTGGPYEIVRHPVYTGLLLFVINYSQGYYSMFQYLAFLLFLVLILLRINHDEEMTKRFFKHEYSKYKKRVKRLIPYIY